MDADKTNPSSFSIRVWSRLSAALQISAFFCNLLADHMANAKALSDLEALPTSPSLAQTLPSDAVLDALKMILPGAPLNEVLTTIIRLIEAHSTEMLCSIFLLDEGGLHLRCGVAASLPEAYRAATAGICIGPTACLIEQPACAIYLQGQAGSATAEPALSPIVCSQ
jgi:hypothetical protein